MFSKVKTFGGATFDPSWGISGPNRVQIRSKSGTNQGLGAGAHWRKIKGQRE